MFSKNVTGRKCLAVYCAQALEQQGLFKSCLFKGRITYMGSNCLYKTRLFVVKPLVGKQLLIKKIMFCELLKWISKIQPTFHCSEIRIWKTERFLN